MKRIELKPINIIVVLILLLGSCKKDRQTNEQRTPARLLKSINTNRNGLPHNFILDYDADGKVSYVGSPDHANGYYYSYQGAEISRITHKIGGLQYILSLTYSDAQILSNAEFTVENSMGVVSSFPLACQRTGDLSLVSSDSNDLTYLQLHLVDGKLIKSSTNSWYLKSSITFQYNSEKGRIFADVVPISKLNNPLDPATAVRVNELISLFLQVFSPKQLISFRVRQSLGKLNYKRDFRDLAGIECLVEDVDEDGKMIKATKTDINYGYTK